MIIKELKEILNQYDENIKVVVFNYDTYTFMTPETKIYTNTQKEKCLLMEACDIEEDLWGEYEKNEEFARKDEREKIKDFIISRGEMNEKQILKELYEYLD